ncbi:Uncharacterised protein [uncultured archaeon]|nr:Uncharacterised protein [uncultured archaeon]
MIEIVCKGFKFIQKQIDDFCGVVNQTAISLKSAEGRKKYEEVFKRKMPEKTKAIKTRILSVFQTKLSDFSGKIIRIIRKCQEILCGNVHISFKEPDQIQKKRPQKTHPISNYQTRLTDFLDDTISFIKRKIRLPYKTKPVQVKEQYLSGKLPDNQRIAFQEYPTFHGYLGNIFMLNPSIDTYFIDLQLKLGYEPQQDNDILNLNNIFKLEVARCKLGRPHFNSWIDEINYNESLRAELGIKSNHELNERSYKRNLRIVSLGLKEYAQRILQECRDLNLIGDKIWIWDRRFFECNCSGVKDKKTGKLSDPNAGHYVKKTGKYSVLTGTGYTDTGFVDHLWGLPIYWDAVGANKNDNTIFKETVIGGFNDMKSFGIKPKFLLSDAGPDSHDSNKLVLEYEAIPVIAARYNSVGDVIKTDEGDCFRGEYIPREYHRILGRLYDIRTIIERKNSNEVVGYNRSEMPNRGIDWARCFVTISNITAILTGLTACKVGRCDLIRAPSAFRRLTV